MLCFGLCNPELSCCCSFLYRISPMRQMMAIRLSFNSQKLTPFFVKRRWEMKCMVILFLFLRCSINICRFSCFCSFRSSYQWNNLYANEVITYWLGSMTAFTFGYGVNLLWYLDEVRWQIDPLTCHLGLY